MKQRLSAFVVDIIVLILFSVIVFVIPIPKTGVFWLSYVFALLAIVSQLGFAYVAFCNGESARSKFYGFPVFRIGLLYLIVQMALSLVFMLLLNWMPVWIPFLLYVILLGVASIGLIAADNVRDTVSLVEEKQHRNTSMMRLLRQDAEALMVRYPELSDFAEQLRCSDPVSTSATADLEQQLHRMLVGFCQLPDLASRVRVSNQMMDMLLQRNVLCKSSKRK